MYKFKDLLKQIRSGADLTQEELARAIGVSTMLISMIETGQKEPSKALVVKLAEKMEVSPSSLMPFVLPHSDLTAYNMSNIEKAFVSLGEKLQTHLIEVKSKKLKQYAKKT